MPEDPEKQQSEEQPKPPVEGLQPPTGAPEREAQAVRAESREGKGNLESRMGAEQAGRNIDAAATKPESTDTGQKATSVAAGAAAGGGITAAAEGIGGLFEKIGKMFENVKEFVKTLVKKIGAKPIRMITGILGIETPDWAREVLEPTEIQEALEQALGKDKVQTSPNESAHLTTLRSRYENMKENKPATFEAYYQSLIEALKTQSKPPVSGGKYSIEDLVKISEPPKQKSPQEQAQEQQQQTKQEQERAQQERLTKGEERKKLFITAFAQAFNEANKGGGGSYALDIPQNAKSLDLAGALASALENNMFIEGTGLQIDKGYLEDTDTGADFLGMGDHEIETNEGPIKGYGDTIRQNPELAVRMFLKINTGQLDEDRGKKAVLAVQSILRRNEALTKALAEETAPPPPPPPAEQTT